MTNVVSRMLGLPELAERSDRLGSNLTEHKRHQRALRVENGFATYGRISLQGPIPFLPAVWPINRRNWARF